VGSILASAIITKGRLILNEATPNRWQDADLLGWLNDGQRHIVGKRPDASSAISNLTLVVGTKQSIGAGALRLLDVMRNMGAGGATPGAPITLVDRKELEAYVPDWHSRASAAAIEHYTYDERTPGTWYCYPPATAGIQVEALQSVSPTDIATTATAITLDDIYEPVLLDYMLYRAYLKNSTAGDSARAMQHLAAANAALGDKSKADVGFSPSSTPKG